MKGLERYIKKHGNHLTEELAYKAAGKKWSSKEVEDSAQKKVYYNVTSATLGDMVFLTNAMYQDKKWPKDKCIDFCLMVIGDYWIGEGCALKMLIATLKTTGIKFDFTPYI